MRVVHFEETDEKARAKADSYPLEPHFLEYYGIDEEFVVNTLIGFGSEPRSKGTDNPTPRWPNGSVFAHARQFYDFLTENDLTLSANPKVFGRKIAEARERLGFTSCASTDSIGTMSTELVDKSIRLFREPVIPTSHASSQTVAPVITVPQREGPSGQADPRRALAGDLSYCVP